MIKLKEKTFEAQDDHSMTGSTVVVDLALRPLSTVVRNVQPAAARGPPHLTTMIVSFHTLDETRTRELTKSSCLTAAIEYV
jgi:hypothetical protein